MTSTNFHYDFINSHTLSLQTVSKVNSVFLPLIIRLDVLKCSHLINMIIIDIKAAFKHEINPVDWQS